MGKLRFLEKGFVLGYIGSMWKVREGIRELERSLGGKGVFYCWVEG